MVFPRAVLMVLPLLFASWAGTAAGAQRLSLAPEIGLYVPTEKLVDAANGVIGELEAGPAFGLRLALSLGTRLSVNVGASYVPTTFALRPEGGTPETRDARLFNGTGQVLFSLLPPASPLSLFVSGGVGVVSRGGVAFSDDAETSDVAGVLGGGASLRLGGVTLTAGADLFSYTGQYRGTAPVASELKQLDVDVRLGLGIPLGGRNGRTPMN